VKKKIVVKLF